ETEKQAQGIAEISQMMASMDSVTQQNAAMVEESTASARNLSSETVRLVGQLGMFRIGSTSYATRIAQPVAYAEPASYAAPAPVRGNLAVKVDDDWTEF